jgi:hypothetical protein
MAGLVAVRIVTQLQQIADEALSRAAQRPLRSREVAGASLTAQHGGGW